SDDGGGPCAVLPVTDPGGSGPCNTHVSPYAMLHCRTTIAAAVTLLLVAAAPVRAADVAPNDVARFIAGMPPAADSPLAALTKDKAWQDHAKTFDASFASAGENVSRVRAWS